MTPLNTATSLISLSIFLTSTSTRYAARVTFDVHFRRSFESNWRRALAAMAPRFIGSRSRSRSCCRSRATVRVFHMLRALSRLSSSFTRLVAIVAPALRYFRTKHVYALAPFSNLSWVCVCVCGCNKSHEAQQTAKGTTGREKKNK